MFVQIDEPLISRMILKLEEIAIKSKEDRCRCERRSFVAVEKGMVLRQAFPERSSLLDFISVIPGLGAAHCGLEPSTVPDPMNTPKQPYAVSIDLNHFFDTEE